VVVPPEVELLEPVESDVEEPVGVAVEVEVAVGSDVGVDVDVLVEVGLAGGDRMLVTVSHRPVRGSMIAHVGEREIWASDTSVPPERSKRVIRSPKLAPRDRCMTTRLKRRPFIVPTPPGSPVEWLADPVLRQFFAGPEMTKPKYSQF
jgi:hypothetical protein